MTQFIGFGDGSDGAATLSGTDAPIDSACSGTSGLNALTATNASFAAGQVILIHQTRGTNAGAWEINKIDSYVAGTITTVIPLQSDYASSGDDAAQVLVVPQYSEVTISGTLTAKLWNGTVGGIIAFMCSGTVTISGTVTATGKGFSNYGTFNSSHGIQGEGTAGQGAALKAANGNGGGGGDKGKTPDYNIFEGGGGGGGGNANAGTAGQGTYGDSGTRGGTAGAAAGSSDLSTMVFGGEGGGGGPDGPSSGNAGNGGNGGGIILIFCDYIVVTGTIVSGGSNGSNQSSNFGGGGGGGAGGSIFIKARVAVLGSNLITAPGGSGGSGNSLNDGGAGSVGRIRCEACSVSGTTNPSNSATAGGYNWCTTLGAIL